MSSRFRWLRIRASQARSSSSSRALPSESIGSACSIRSKCSSGGAPTRWVGESGVRSSGFSSSIARSSSSMRS